MAFILEAVAAGRRPSEDELLGFHRTSGLPQTIESYRQQAEELLAEFSTGVLSGKAAEIEAAYKEALIEHLSGARPFWRGVWQSVIASVVVIILGVALVVIVWAGKYGVKEVAEQVFDVTIEKRAVPDQESR